MSVRIMLADDHNLVRQGLGALLKNDGDFELVGEVEDGLKVLPEVERKKPDVLVLDLMIPGLNGLEVTRRVAQKCPDVRVLILSMHANEGYVLRALQNGAAGYVLKQSQATDLITAIREVMSGRRYLSPPLSELAIQAFLQKTESESFDLYDTLTNREREVFQLTAECHTNSETAKLLYISLRTVETHRAKVMEKLGLKNKSDLIHFAVSRGIILRDR